MTVVVGYTTQDSGISALELASVLARSTGEQLLVAVVIATPHVGGAPDRVDGDYLGPLVEWGESVLDRARASLPDDITATFEVRQAASIHAGLLDLAAGVDASAVVLGSSSKGSLGRISFGSITDRMVHVAPLPVFLAPRGFRSGPTSRIRRVSVAYAASPHAPHVLEAGVGLAGAVGADVRAVSFVVRPPKRFFGAVEQSADDLVVQQWVARTQDSLEAGVAGLSSSLGEQLAASLVVGEGVSWNKAIWDVPWGDGDVLVVGPSSTAPAARLFLGSRASKIVRSAPVPVLLVPAP